MEIDVVRVLGLVSRSVRNFEKDGKAASAVTLTRLYDTDVDDLWDALTSKERIPRWFLPVEGDLRLGGRYQLKGNAGGTITACTPPDHFAATWEFGGCDELDRRQAGGRARQGAVDAGAHRDHRGSLEPVRSRRGGYRLGPLPCGA